jgi:hypothetical protein
MDADNAAHRRLSWAIGSPGERVARNLEVDLWADAKVYTLLFVVSLESKLKRKPSGSCDMLANISTPSLDAIVNWSCPILPLPLCCQLSGFL